MAVLQQHQRLAHRLARHRAMRRRAEQLEAAGKRPRRRMSLAIQVRAQLDAQHAADRIVEPCGVAITWAASRNWRVPGVPCNPLTMAATYWRTSAGLCE
jgi:hypothetical protein